VNVWLRSTKKLFILVERDGMDPEGAIEYLEFNTLGAWVRDGTPTYAVLFE
jgi:hypothetical protein